MIQKIEESAKSEQEKRPETQGRVRRMAEDLEQKIQMNGGGEDERRTEKECRRTAENKKRSVSLRRKQLATHSQENGSDKNSTEKKKPKLLTIKNIFEGIPGPLNGTPRVKKQTQGVPFSHILFFQQKKRKDQEILGSRLVG